MFETHDEACQLAIIKLLSPIKTNRKSNIMATLLKANEQTKNHDIDLSKLPQNLDMTAESITANVHAINANCQPSQHIFKILMILTDVSLSRPGWSLEIYIQESRRCHPFKKKLTHKKLLTTVFFGQVNHLHDFVRETSLTSEEWTYANFVVFSIRLFTSLSWFGCRTAINFLTETGKISTDVRQGVFHLIVLFYKWYSHCILCQNSYCYLTLLESLPSSTRSTTPSLLERLRPPSSDLSTLMMRMKVRTWFLRWTFFLIPFASEEKGDSIASEGKGDYMFVEGVVKDLRGKPIANATIDTWETDGDGRYDNQVRDKNLLPRF